jgi:3-methyladenine DNA glycosylase/8-oxoguanine DNA glycosylase
MAEMAPFRLQFPVGDIPALAARYDFDSDHQVATAGASARERGYYTKPELVLICAWKTVRSRSRVAENTAAFVEGMTRVAFAMEDESERMAALCALRGVNPPTASVLLHFAFPDRYPIIDWRALESLGQARQPAYTIDYWLAYLDACRDLASHAGVTMRVLDKALWQYSRERQR